MPEPLEPLVPVLGEVLGVGEVLGEVVLPVAPAPEPDLLKWASHSEREICPSLLVSTAEKLGAEVLAPALALPLAPLPDDALPLALGVLLAPDEPLAPDAAGELGLSALDELCAKAIPDSANSAAAVAALSNFRFNIAGSPCKMGMNCDLLGCKTRAPAGFQRA